MSKSRFILAIFLLILLIAVGIVLPYIWKMEHQASKREAQKTEPVVSVEPSTIPLDVEYVAFDGLEKYFTPAQVQTFQEYLASYLGEAGDTKITSVTFLPKETTYPDRYSVQFAFRLSDETILPVTYRLDNGTFFFGDEQVERKTEWITYERITDDSLPSVTAGEIDACQEGGFDDTTKQDKEVQP